jgi:putative membrane protein
MFKRQCARAFITIAIVGLAGCESTDFNYPGKTALESAQTPAVEKSSSPDFNQAQLASAQFEGQSGASAIDNKLFTIQAGSDSRLQLRMAKLAEQKSSNLMIRRFAARISQEHQALDDQIKMLAQARNYAAADVLMPEQQTTFDSLAAVNGDDFDRQFLESQIRTLEGSIQLYQGGSGLLPDNELRSFAARTLPTLQDELQTARDDLRNMASSVR